MIKEYKGFKIGDKVTAIVGSSLKEGTLAMIFPPNSTSYPLRVVWDKSPTSEYGYSVAQIEHLSKKAKKTKIVKHVIVTDSCNNFTGFKDNFKDSVKYLQNKQINESYSIYKMVLVAKVSPDVKVKMIRGKKR